MRRESIATVLGGVIAAAAIFSLSTESCGILDNGGLGGFDAGVASRRIGAPSSGCVAAQAGDIPYVPISLEIANLQLQPPGVCSQELTTVSSTVGTGLGVGGAGGAGGASISFQCGHLAVFVCTEASTTDKGSLFDDGHKHCPRGTPVNNEGSGTEIDVLLPDLRDPSPGMPFNELHVDLFLAREARFIGDLVDAETPFPPQVLDLCVLQPGGTCDSVDAHCPEAKGGGGAGGKSGTGGKGGAGGA